MSYTPGYVQVAPNSTGQGIDGAIVTDGGQSVMRQIVALGDPSVPAGVAQVLSADPVGTEQALVVRNIPMQGISTPITPGDPGQTPAAQSFPVVLASDQSQDTFSSVGPVAVTASMNLLTGTTAGLDTMAGAASYRSFAAQINNNGTGNASLVSVTWQGSNDNVNWVSIPVHDLAGSGSTAILSGAFQITAATVRYFTGKCQFRYLKLTSTATYGTGGMSSFVRLNLEDIADTVSTVISPSAANFLTTATVTGTVSLSGTANTVQIGNTPNTTPILNTPCPGTSATAALSSTNLSGLGALSTFKASAGNLYGFSILNNTASPVFLEFWNVAAGSVTLGTTVPTLVFCIPASGALTVPPSAMALMNGAAAMSYAAVTAYNGATTASITGSILYK